MNKSPVAFWMYEWFESWYIFKSEPAPKIKRSSLDPSDVSPRVIFPPIKLIPDLAVIIPTESIFVTSSYVNVPPIDTLPVNAADDPFIAPVKVVTPATLTLSKFVWPSTSKSPPTLTFPWIPAPPATLNAPVVLFVDWVAAFTTKINVPPPGQIDIDRGGRINAFDNNYDISVSIIYS